jgi:hypothetical protein
MVVGIAQFNGAFAATVKLNVVLSDVKEFKEALLYC